MNKIDCNTTTYDMGDGFRVDIMEADDNYYEAWIYHENYGQKDLMFGSAEIANLGHFVEMVEANFHDYRRDYFLDVMCDD